jgi:hypothetical protein
MELFSKDIKTINDLFAHQCRTCIMPSPSS